MNTSNSLTTTAPSIHNFAPGMDLRTTSIDGEPWFVAKDVCASLNFRDAHNATRGLDPDERKVSKVSTLGGIQSVTMVSESGLYKLIMRSNKLEAKAFQDWVTKEVLPSIRKHGGYLTFKVAEEAVENTDAFMTKALAMANERMRLLADAHVIDA